MSDLFKCIHCGALIGIQTEKDSEGFAVYYHIYAPAEYDHTPSPLIGSNWNKAI